MLFNNMQIDDAQANDFREEPDAKKRNQIHEISRNLAAHKEEDRQGAEQRFEISEKRY